MSGIVKIDNEEFSSEDFVTLLKLNGRFENLMEDILKDKVAVHLAKKRGITLTDEEIQERADQFRRAHGLQRARDTNEYFKSLGVTLDAFEVFINETLYQEKMLEQVGTDREVEEYFKLHSPKFDSIKVSHILMDSEGGAREMYSVLSDDPDSFADMAREHSVADTREAGGSIGKVMRGSLQSEVEAKVFNAQAGDLLGPFASGDGVHFEIFRVDAKNSAKLDEDTSAEIRRILRDQWLASKARELRIEML